MRARAGSLRVRAHWLLAGLAVILVTLCAAAEVLADAADPVPQAATASVGPVTTVNGVQVATVTVSGRWQWPTHATDCTTDRSGVGYAVDWNDPNQPGNVVTTLPAPIGTVAVGAAAANAYNPADNEVHPTPAVPGTNTVFNDPNVTPPSSTSVGVWRGGCGTFTGTNPQGKPMSVGTWGPISHVYTLAAIQSGLSICAIMYDVHGTDSDSTTVTNGFAGGVPKGTGEITAGGSGHNGDNGAEDNKNTPLGNTCAPIVLPSITTTATNATLPGGSITDTATVNGVAATVASSVTFNAYTNSSCTGAAAFTSTKSITGSGSVTSGSFGAAQGLAGGTYYWQDHYAGDAASGTQPVDTVCGDTGNGNSEQSIAGQPSISLTKDAACSKGTASVDCPATKTYSAVGQLITYTYTITNSGNTTLGPAQFTVTDDKQGSFNCGPSSTTLAPGATVACTSMHTITQADLDAGSITNVATASGAGLTTNQATQTVTGTQTPGLGVAKFAACSTGTSGVACPSTTSYSTIGQLITYTYNVVNTGNTTLAGPFTIADNKQGTISPCGSGPLAPGATTTCTSTHTITQADIDAGSITNVACASGNGLTSNPCATATVTTTPNPALSIVKSANPTTYDHVGQVITYTYTITNSGNVTLTGPFSVSDNKIGTISPCGSATTLAPNATTSCTATHAITQADLDAGSITNVACASGGGQTTNPCATTTVTGQPKPGLTIAKIANPTTYDHVGQVITYTYTITNSGNVTLTGPFSVSDNKLGTISPCGSATTLAPGAITSCTSTHTITQADLDAGSITNVACASGGGQTTNPCATVTITSNPNASIAIAKSPTSQTVDSGGTASFTITVTNTGNVTLTNVAVNDPLTAGCNKTIGTLTPGQSTSYGCSQAGVTSAFTNVAVATGHPPTGPDVSASASATVAVNPPPSTPPSSPPSSPPPTVTVVTPAPTPAPTPTPVVTPTPKPAPAVKKKAPLAPPSRPQIGIVKSPKNQTLTTTIVKTGSTTTPHYGTAHFTITVTNHGNVRLTAVRVDDALAPSCTRHDLGTLAPGSSHTYTCSLTSVKRDFVNVAVASGKPPKGPRVVASDHAAVHVKFKTVSSAPAKYTG